jgi:hypothetical protein
MLSGSLRSSRVEGALRDGARVASSNGAAGEGPGRTNVMAVPSEDNLRRLAALLNDGTLQVHVHNTFEFVRAIDALQASPPSTSAASSRSAFASDTHHTPSDPTKEDQAAWASAEE